MPSSPDLSGAGAAAPRRRTPILGAFLEGWRRVWAAPARRDGAGGWAVSSLLALPRVLVMERAIKTHRGSSLEADAAATGWNAGWATEFGAQAQGVAGTFSYDFLGFGGTPATISGHAHRH